MVRINESLYVQKHSNMNKITTILNHESFKKMIYFYFIIRIMISSKSNRKLNIQNNKTGYKDLSINSNMATGCSEVGAESSLVVQPIR